MTLQISDQIDQVSSHKNKVFSILRDYQATSVNESLASLERNIDTLLQSPTGSGKSLMMIAITLENLSKGKRVGLLIHKEELLNQWIKNLREWLPEGFSVGIIGDKGRYGKLKNIDAPLQIMMAKSLKNSDKPDLDLLILDECHHAPAKGWADIIEYYKGKNTQIFGATATPKRLDGKPLTQFKKLIPGPQGQELIDLGHLVPTEILASQYAINTDGFKLRLGDYDQKISSDAIAKIRPQDIYREWLINIGPDKLCVVYPASVTYSRLLNNYFNFQMPGISAHIDSKTPHKDRKRILDDFANGKIKILFQHSIIIEGVDIPEIEAIICLRPTASLSIWLQILGRGLRPAPGKDKLILLDFTDNHLKLPLLSDEIIWDLEGQEKIENIAHCPSCGDTRRFEVTKEVDHGIYIIVTKSCVKCGHEIKSKKAVKREKGPDTYRSLMSGIIYKKILPKKIWDFSREGFYGLIADVHSRDKNNGLAEVVTEWNKNNKKSGITPVPTDDIYLLVYNAFVSKVNDLVLPDRLLPGLDEKIAKGQEAWADMSDLLGATITKDIYDGSAFLISKF